MSNAEMSNVDNEDKSLEVTGVDTWGALALMSYTGAQWKRRNSLWCGVVW
jgi:hypothetical protein